MRFLLDVNTLIALGVLEHEFHHRVAAWLRTATAAGTTEMVTCSITETGFVRVLAQTVRYGLSVVHARELLLQLKSGPTMKFSFLADDQSISGLPGWVKTPKQITDGHLWQLARSHRIGFATLDRSIPDALLIP